MIPFLKYKPLYFIISTIVIGVGLLSIALNGFNLSIDFEGGTVLEYKTNKDVGVTQIKQIIDQQHIKLFEIKNPEKKRFIIRTVPLDQNQQENVRKLIEKNTGVTITILQAETVGPTIGQETLHKTLLAALVALFGILAYMTFAFKKVSYGLAAILAMVHDFLVVVGTYSLFGKLFGAQVDTLFVTALLTTMAFSVHDTIIVFDKVREYRKYDRISPIETLANKAFTETIVRSLNNSLTIMLMLLALVLLGGDTIRFFAATLLVGTITGTYSSPFIATPLLAILERRKK